VNGDGRPDLVAANSYSNSVSVLLGNGNGTFNAAKNFAVGLGPDSVAVADVNGDGRPDLITANKVGYSVSVLLGNGNGTFHKATNFGAGTRPYAVAVADLNGDGLPDLVVANEGNLSNPGIVSVLLGSRNAATPSQVSDPAGSTAGTPFPGTGIALTAGNQPDALDTGTVHFTSAFSGFEGNYPFVSTDEGRHLSTATMTVNAAGRAAHVRPPFDLDGDVLNPAGVDAFFAQ
jgi:hypothetical protein